MNAADATVVLKGAHVFDPAQNIDGKADVAIAGDKIAAVGDFPTPPNAEVVDCAGAYVSPGWIDIHVHAYGKLGFADPDSIGIFQGVTSFIEAGGPGVGTFDEFLAMMGGLQTRLYSGLYIRPLGILGIGGTEDDVRNLGEIPIRRLLDLIDRHRDTIRYFKVGAFDKHGAGPLRVAKGLAELMGLPIYVHTGDAIAAHDDRPPIRAAFDVAEKGDIITHIYHKNFSHILDENDKVVPSVFAAARRGVLFDIGFGGANFSWDVAEKAYAQGVVTDIISSDLQQLNVIGPTFSLANVLSIHRGLGFSLRDVIERVTWTPAKALSLTDRAGSLRPGMPADITVFRTEAGAFELLDCFDETRTVGERIVPSMAFKDGVRVDSDLERCQDERNWFMEIIEDHIPETAERLSGAQLAFLRELADELATIEWEVVEPRRMDLDKVTALQAAVYRARERQGIPLADALRAVYACFIYNSFAIQIGLFLICLDRRFALERLAAVTSRTPAAA